MTPSDEEEFIIEQLRKDSDSLLKILGDVDIEKAETSKALDKKWILKYISGSTSTAELNNIITENLRKWFLDVAFKYDQENKFKGGAYEGITGIHNILSEGLTFLILRI